MSPSITHTEARGNVYGSMKSNNEKSVLGQDDFLKILIVQLQNQDPMQPMQDRDFIAQMATFTSLEQMTNMNKAMQEMRGMMLGQATSYVGKEIIYEVDVYDYADGKFIGKEQFAAVVAGFAGSVADAFTLFEKFEGKLEEFHGNLSRAAVELAKEWRMDKVLRRLEAMLIVMNKDELLLISGNGEVIEPDDDILAIGSGGAYALSAGRALKNYASHLSAREIAEAALNIAGDICVFTNNRLIIEEL